MLFIWFLISHNSDIDLKITGMSSKNHIILAGENYVIWKKYVEVQCQRKGAKRVLTQTTFTDSVEEGEAQTIIMQSLGIVDQYRVASCKSAKEMIDKLERRYKNEMIKSKQNEQAYLHY